MVVSPPSPKGPDDAREQLGFNEPKKSSREAAIFQQTKADMTQVNDQAIQAQKVKGSEDITEIYNTALKVLTDPKIADAIDAHFDLGGSWQGLAASLLKVPEFTSKYSEKCLKEVAIRYYFKHLTNQVIYSPSKEPVSVEEGLERVKSYKQEFQDIFKENKDEFEMRMTKAIEEVNQTLREGHVEKTAVEKVLGDSRVLDFMEGFINGGGSWKDLLSDLQSQFKEYPPKILKEALLQAYLMDIAENIDLKNSTSLQYRSAFEKQFPEHRDEFDQRLRNALAFIQTVNSVVPVTTPEVEKASVPMDKIHQFIDDFLHAYLDPYLEGKITPQNEPQPHIPVIETIKKEVRKQFGDISEEKIEEASILAYVKIVLSHNEAILGRKLYDNMHTMNMKQSNTKKQKNIYEEVALKKYNELKNIKLNPNRDLLRDEVALSKAIQAGLQRDFPGVNFELKAVQMFMKQTLADLIARTPQITKRQIIR